MKKRVLNYSFLAVCFFAGFAAVAGVPSPPDAAAGPAMMAAASVDASALQPAAQDALSALQSGQYLAAVLLAIVLFVGAARKYGASQWPWLASKTGAAVLTLVGAFAAALAAAADAGSLGWPDVYGAFKLAAGAAGGYSLVRILGGPILDALTGLPYVGRAAVLIRMAIDLFFAPRQELEKARLAGEAAVEAKPSPGVSLGDPLP